MKRGMKAVTVQVGETPIKTNAVSLAVTVSHVFIYHVINWFYFYYL